MSDKKEMHPNSLKNLTMKLGNTPEEKERAREMQRKGLETRRKNKELRESMKMSQSEFKKFKEELLDPGGLSAMDVLRIQMVKAMHNDDMDTAVDIAKTLAEFEQPKLARIDQTNTEIKATDMTDEELAAKIEEARATLKVVK